MAELIKCMECGGMVSSEANQCPHCKGSFRGVKCKACGGLLTFSEAIKVRHSFYEDTSEYFHNSCYQQITCEIVEKKKTINCPVCAQPNQFSYGNYRYHRYSRRHDTERINCANCGHPYEYEQSEANDPYANCKYCEFLLEKDLEVKILNPQNNKDYYAHKLCNNKERQAQELETKKYYENQEMMRNEEKHKMERKEAMENANGCLQQTLIPMLILGGFCIYWGGFSLWLFGVSFTVYLILIALMYIAT